MKTAIENTNALKMINLNYGDHFKFMNGLSNRIFIYDQQKGQPKNGKLTFYAADGNGSIELHEKFQFVIPVKKIN